LNTVLYHFKSIQKKKKKNKKKIKYKKKKKKKKKKRIKIYIWYEKNIYNNNVIQYIKYILLYIQYKIKQINYNIDFVLSIYQKYIQPSIEFEYFSLKINFKS